MDAIHWITANIYMLYICICKKSISVTRQLPSSSLTKREKLKYVKRCYTLFFASSVRASFVKERKSKSFAESSIHKRVKLQITFKMYELVYS